MFGRRLCIPKPSTRIALVSRALRVSRCKVFAWGKKSTQQTRQVDPCKEKPDTGPQPSVIFSPRPQQGVCSKARRLHFPGSGFHSSDGTGHCLCCAGCPFTKPITRPWKSTVAQSWHRGPGSCSCPAAGKEGLKQGVLPFPLPSFRGKLIGIRETFLFLQVTWQFGN